MRVSVPHGRMTWVVLALGLLIALSCPVDARAEPPMVRVLWVAPQPPQCRAVLYDPAAQVRVPLRTLVVEDCAARAERAVQQAFAEVSKEQAGGWRFDVTVPSFRVLQQDDELTVTLVLAVTEPSDRRALLRASGQGRVLLQPGMLPGQFSARVEEALTVAAKEGALLLRNRVSMPVPATAQGEPEPTTWLGLEGRSPWTFLLSGQRRVSEWSSLLLEVNPGTPSPIVQVGTRLDIWRDEPWTWQLNLRAGVQWPAWWRPSCRLSACTDLDQRVVLAYVDLGTGVAVRLLPRHALRLDVSLQAGAQWAALQPVAALHRGVASVGYAFGF